MPAVAQGGPLTIRSLCPREADRRCVLALYDAGGTRTGEMEVDNQSGLAARDAGRDLLEVQLQGRTVLIGRLGVVLARQRAPAGRVVDCERVAGVRGSDCAP